MLTPDGQLDAQYGSEGHTRLHQRLASEQGMCNAFRAPNVSCVAIVGNGPLDDVHRQEIHACDIVIRWAAHSA